MIAIIQPYLPSLAGGMLIGLAAGLFYLGEGRIAGISSIARAAFEGGGWRWAFLAGVISAGLVHAALGGTPAPALGATSLPILGLGGLLVGFGSGLGSGCTSGHGVCGLARLSPRSLIAVLVFMATASITVFVMYHVVSV
jgi:uncharacterized membrane protein YedE/YeeE